MNCVERIFIFRTVWPLLLAGACVSGAVEAGSAELSSGEVVLTLEGGGDPGPMPLPTGAPRDMELEFVLRDGAWAKDVWGYATGLNRCNHRGVLESCEPKGGGVQIAVKMEVVGDYRVPGGAAAYRIEVQRSGRDYTGTYSGQFLDQKVQGRARGVIREPLVRAVAGFQPLGPQEHPRLIFRPKDREELKRRAETPEGKAILAMLEAAPVRSAGQVDDRRSSWLAANWGAVYQLTGAKEAADKARRVLVDEVVRKPMPMDRADIHLAPRLLGVALAFDLCYDAWDEEFRSVCAEYLHYFMLSLQRGYNAGLPIEDFNPEPWSHHTAMRMGAVGLAAIALLGEKGLGGSIHAEAQRALEIAQRDILRYLRRGVGESGWAVEGDFYKKFAMGNGLLQFLHAARVALGRDLSRVNPYLLAEYVAAADPLKQNSTGISIRALQASGLYPMGLGSAPTEFLPILKWCFDREAGLSGARHFDCTYPYQAAYALMNYPFGVEARPPGDAFPWALRDDASGHYVLRSAWKDGDDVLTTVHLRSGAYPNIQRQHTGKAFDVTISGLGRRWLAGPVGLAERNPFLGAELVSFSTPRPKQAVLSAAMDKAYLELVRQQPVRRRRDEPKDPLADEQRPEILWGADAPLSDAGVKVKRHFAVDYSGVCGAPALFVLIDQVQAQSLGKGGYDLGLKEATFSGSSFTMGEPGGPSLKGLVVTPASSRGRLMASPEYFIVFTIQNGAPPPMKADGAGLKARVTIGGQTVSFDGEKIVLEK